MSTPDWIGDWDPPTDWAWKRRSELWDFACRLLSFGPIIIGNKDSGVRAATPRDVMNNTARMNEKTWVAWRNRLDKAKPPEPRPKHLRSKTTVPTAKYPALPDHRMQALVDLVASVYAAMPDADVKLQNLHTEFVLKRKLGKPTAAVEKSMWAALRVLGDEADRRYARFDLPITVAVEYRTRFPTIFGRLIAVRHEHPEKEQHGPQVSEWREDERSGSSAEESRSSEGSPDATDDSDRAVPP